MVPPIDNFIEAPARTRVRVGLAPVQNAIHSLLLLARTEEFSGLGDWVLDTASKLSLDERTQHYRIMIGFYHAILPEKNWSSFPIYLDHLEQMDPESLKSKMLQSYFRIAVEHSSLGNLNEDSVLETADSYLSFLKESFGAKKIDEDLERWAYSYVIDPPAMRDLLVNHLRKIWDGYLAEEWARIKPTLEKAVKAFQQVDFSEMNDLAITEYVTGQSLDAEFWEHKCQESENLYFVPSLHVGPYIGNFYEGDTLGFIFGARLPDNAPIHAPELSQAEIYMRLNALADETRLQVLKYIANQGESCSTEIINALALSQSAASRHLKQLTAAGYLIARRIDGAKCFRLDKERIGNTLDTIKVFLML